MEYVVLNNKVKMPKLGYGVFQIPNDECEACVSTGGRVSSYRYGKCVSE